MTELAHQMQKGMQEGGACRVIQAGIEQVILPKKLNQTRED